MKLLRGKMVMLTILLLIIMKGTDGPPVRILPSTGPTMTIKACVGENKQFMTKDESAQEDIITSQWIFRKGNASSTTDDVILCKMETSGMFEVNLLYSSRVEQCNTTSILLKNISFLDEGYYILQFLKEKIGSTESLPIFLTVSDTPAKQCKPVIRSHSGNMLNCSTQCEQFDVEWRLNKGGDVVCIGSSFNPKHPTSDANCNRMDLNGCLDQMTTQCDGKWKLMEWINSKGNESILLVDCLWKNESILCCLKSRDMEFYKGDRLDLCAQITPSYCTENKPGENGHDVHADKAPDNPGINMLVLLTVLIILGILSLVVLYVLYRKKILSCTTMCQDTNKSIPSSSVSAEPHADLNDVQVPEETVPMLTNDQEPHADVNDVQVPEMPSPILGTVQELDADVKLDQIQEKTFPILNADVQQVQLQEITSPMLDVGQDLDADVQHIQEQDPVHETEEAGTEPNSEITREIQELRHAVMCKICFVRRMSVLFMPCNHMATCDNCSSAFGKCPICRTKIEKIENIRYD